MSIRKYRVCFLNDDSEFYTTMNVSKVQKKNLITVLHGLCHILRHKLKHCTIPLRNHLILRKTTLYDGIHPKSMVLIFCALKFL